MSDSAEVNDNQYQEFVTIDYEDRVKAPAKRAVEGKGFSGRVSSTPAQEEVTPSIYSEKAKSKLISIFGETVTIQGRKFRIGDIRLNPSAARDIRLYGNLLTGVITKEALKEKERLKKVIQDNQKSDKGKKAEKDLHALQVKEATDRPHIYVHDTLVEGRIVSRLGYEISHTDPYDPFRWNKLKEIVDMGHVDIFSTTSGDYNCRVPDGNKLTTIEENLKTIPEGGAGGITLVHLSVAQKLWDKEKKLKIDKLFGPKNLTRASMDNTRDQIYYLSGKEGLGQIGENSLAHEFFGHLWLMMLGVPWQHPQSPDEMNEKLKQRGKPGLTPEERAAARLRLDRFGTLKEEHRIRDPYGKILTQEILVKDYINRYAGALYTSKVESPTHWVSDRHLEKALDDLFKILLDPSVTKLVTSNTYPADLFIKWTYVSNNYEMLYYSPNRLSVWSNNTERLSEGLLKLIVEWYNEKFNDKQRKWFKGFLNIVLSDPEVSLPRRFAQDILSAIR